MTPFTTRHIRTRHVALACAATLVLIAAACGGGNGGGGGGGGTPTSPSTPPDVPAGTLITITGSGVSPKSLTVPAGTRVTFFNNSNTVHDMASDPHPAHTDCSEINQAGFLTSGQSRQTGNLNTRRTCGYHDHNRDTDTSLQGTITIQ